MIALLGFQSLNRDKVDLDRQYGFLSLQSSGFQSLNRDKVDLDGRAAQAGESSP